MDHVMLENKKKLFYQGKFKGSTYKNNESNSYKKIFVNNFAFLNKILYFLNIKETITY